MNYIYRHPTTCQPTATTRDKTDTMLCDMCQTSCTKHPYRCELCYEFSITLDSKEEVEQPKRWITCCSRRESSHTRNITHEVAQHLKEGAGKNPPYSLTDVDLALAAVRVVRMKTTSWTCSHCGATLSGTTSRKKHENSSSCSATKKTTPQESQTIKKQTVQGNRYIKKSQLLNL